MQKLKVKQIRSIIDRPKRQKRTIEALGLGRPNWERIHNDTPQIRGMLNKISHLVEVSEYKPTAEEERSVSKPVVKKTAPAKKASSKKEVKKSTAGNKKESKSE
jgi:large subunit ribosomal protein L30